MGKEVEMGRIRAESRTTDHAESGRIRAISVQHVPRSDSTYQTIGKMTRIVGYFAEFSQLMEISRPIMCDKSRPLMTSGSQTDSA